MPEPLEDTWIVISGHPAKGKRERSKVVRAHVARRHNHQARAARDVEQDIRESSGAGKQGGPRQSHPELSTEPRSLPCTSHAVDFETEATQRMQRFFNSHLPGSNSSHPIYHNVLRWVRNEPYFASAKVLGASAWDDILETGELSAWTLKQHLITKQLLNDVLQKDGGGQDKHATVAAIQSLLGFELLIGDDKSIASLQTFYRSITAQPFPSDDDVGSVLRNCHYMLSHADHLRRMNIHPDQIALHDANTERTRSLPGGTRLPGNYWPFTFGSPTLAESYDANYVLLCDLRHILGIAESSKIPISRSAHDYIISQHAKLLSHIEDPLGSALGPPSLVVNESRNAPIRLSIFMLTECLLNGNGMECEEQASRLSFLVSRLRDLLRASDSKLHISAEWTPFRGALMWCHAIGLRFAGTQSDRTWFMMHFLRVAQHSALERWTETSTSMEMIVGGLEWIGSVSVET